MRRYHSSPSRIAFVPGCIKILLLGIFTAIMGALFIVASQVLNGPLAFLSPLLTAVFKVGAAILCAGMLVMVLALVVTAFNIRNTSQICQRVRYALFDPSYGNPLRFQDGDRLPGVKCRDIGNGDYEITISACGCPVDRMRDHSNEISSVLNGRLKNYAVTRKNVSPTYNNITFRLEDVTVDKSLTYHNVNEMRPPDAAILAVQKGTGIDLRTSGSMLVAGKTRSGKTTGIISMLLQVLLAGPDQFGSEVVIIDPKQAELSMLPHVTTADEDGGARAILAAIQHFNATVTERQQILNKHAKKCGDAVKWWNVGFHPSFLFIDEYVAVRGQFPTKAAKGDEGYTLDAFDTLIKRIAMMGAAAGCFVIISIAQASVGEGGLSSAIRDAVGTRILFSPTLSGARFIWDTAKFDTLNADANFAPGDAWFSSTDGEHEDVSKVHFPRMTFPVYKELGRLLTAYYAKPE